MAGLREFSFPIMNGQCRITSDAIYFDYGRSWKVFCRLFGQPSKKRSLVIAFIFGIPLVLCASAFAVFGHWHLVSTPLLFGAVLTLGAIATFFYEEHSYPDIIPLNAIQSVASQPPAGFTITFEIDGHSQKTSFCLRCANQRDRAETFNAVSDIFAAVV
ncbi:MAG TPA: hypothetical protein VFG20_04525 [Planctomycetaceae bacterium]|nr:hypothetical protein [Planctomycetaceae bacterium]